ncbi:perlucin-like protein [Mytilus trossulus]|uniref:perlucin-like protein n=1 Tax=Mytilus trossulus TaxID=6551 RepID=UPI0030063C73
MTSFRIIPVIIAIVHQVYCQSDISSCPSRIQQMQHVRVYTDACLLFVEHELSWDDARKSCRSLGGDLVMIKDSAKQKFILDSLIFEHWNTQNMWIGATDKAKEGDWRWIDGSSVTYAHFAKGQGNNHNTRRFLLSDGSKEDCALIKRSDGGLWHDYPCDFGLGILGYHYTYACEFLRSGHGTTNGSTLTSVLWRRHQALLKQWHHQQLILT